MPHAAVQPAPSRRAQREALLQEAEAQRALAELFPDLKLQALRAIQDLFPLAQRGARGATDAANEATAH